MKIVNEGPSRTELRRKLGTRQSVTFGAGSDAINVRVGLLCAAGCFDLPIDLPRGPITEQDSAWYVGGDVTDGAGDATFLAIVGYTETGKFQCAVMVLDTDEGSTRLSLGFQLDRIFAEAAGNQFKATLED